jgi:uncharacterized protein (TIGR02466 family)
MIGRQLFATPLYEADIGVPSLLDGLAVSIRHLAEEDAAGRRWSRDKGYKGYTSYASLDDLPQRDPAFAALRPHLLRHARVFADALGWPGVRPRVDSLWVNLLRPGGHHSAHIHPHSALSGTLYIEVPDGAGAIRFEDPRLPMMMAAPPRDPDAPEPLQPFVTLAPTAGKLLLWESWLRHEVLPNRARADRLSISFNLVMR